MILPLYFLNSDDSIEIEEIVDFYTTTSRNYERQSKEIEIGYVIDKLRKRRYLSSKELFFILEAMVIVMESAEVFEDLFDIDFLRCKKIILKLLSSHFSLLEEDNIIDNMQLLQHVYVKLISSKKELVLEGIEKDTFNYLELLNV